MPKISDDYDNPWKELLHYLFETFMAFFFPAAYAQIDWSRKYEMLDKEFQQLLEDAKMGRREADILVKVWLKNGNETWILTHIEIQSQHVKNFEQRVYRYNALINLRYEHLVSSFVILGDDNPDWKPESLDYTILGKRHLFEFWSVKLTDYRLKWEELKKSRNPFAIGVMAHLKALETRKNPINRLHWKYEIAKILLEQGFPRETILCLFRFIDVIMQLPKELERQFQKQIIQYTEEKNMPKTLIPFEELLFEDGKEEGFKQGIEQGIEQGEIKHAHKSILEILEIRFDFVPESIAKSIQDINNVPVLDLLFKTAVKTSSMEEFVLSLEQSR